jgi:Arc-like DNA binding domain
VAQKKKRAPGAGRPRGRVKGATVSLRLPEEMRDSLQAAAERNQRSLSAEIFLRLHYSLARDPAETERPPHITALLEAIASGVAQIEKVTERGWNRDRYTAEHVAKGISRFIGEYSPQGDVVAPPEAVEAAKKWPDPNNYQDHLGEWEFGHVIATIESIPEPIASVRRAPPLPSIYYPESWWGPWKIREALKPKKPKKGDKK